MDIMNYIEINKEIMMGKPVIRGTRISVEMILERFLSGETMEAIQTAYPHITQEAISAAIQFVQAASKMIQNLLVAKDETKTKSF